MQFVPEIPQLSNMEQYEWFVGIWFMSMSVMRYLAPFPFSHSHIPIEYYSRFRAKCILSKCNGSFRCSLLSITIKTLCNVVYINRIYCFFFLLFIRSVCCWVTLIKSLGIYQFIIAIKCHQTLKYLKRKSNHHSFAIFRLYSVIESLPGSWRGIT